MSIGFHIDYEQAVKELGIKEKQLKPILHQALQETGKSVKQDFLRPTRTWSHRVSAEVLTEVTGSGVSMVAGVDDRIYSYLEYGTRPHWIAPKRAKALRFWSGFHPKTTPGSLGAGQGGVFGDIVFSQGVHHPGTKPRRWLPIIEGRARKLLDHTVRKYLARWAR